MLIRDVGIPGHLRVTAGTETETTAFLTSLERILAGQATLPGLDLSRDPSAARLPSTTPSS